MTKFILQTTDQTKLEFLQASDKPIKHIIPEVNELEQSLELKISILQLEVLVGLVVYRKILVPI